MADQNKKTGATPIVEDGLGGGELLGVTKVQTVLVRYRDGHGKTEVKLAIVIPGGEVYFYSNTALDLRPAQKWLKERIMRMPQSGTSSHTLTITEDDSQI